LTGILDTLIMMRKRMTTTYKSKEGLVVPKSMSRAAGWKNGEEMEFKRSGRKVIVSPKAVDPDDILTSAEAKMVSRALKQVREGKTKPLAQIKYELGL
jgi:bifunctional DNA-binding transcriptional regulator/antitoxin component of YhaV-PrlF toxin-antitoxin module